MTEDNKDKKKGRRVAETGGPVAPTPDNQDAERRDETPAAAAEPVAPTPDNQDAEPAPAPTKPEPVAAAPVRSGVSAGAAFFLGLVASLLLIAGLAALAFATLPQWRPQMAALLTPPPDERIGAVEGRTARVSEQVAALTAKVDSLDKAVAAVRAEGARAPAAAAPNVEALTQRLSTVESAPRVDPARVEALAREADKLAKQLAQTQESLAALQKSAADAATVLRLTDRIEVAEKAVREAQSRAHTAQSLLLGVGQLREAINRGDAYDAELRSVRAIAHNDPQAVKSIEALAGLGGKPIATRAQLAAQLDAQAGKLVRANLGPDEDGWWRQTVQRLAAVVTIRRTEGDVAGDSSAAVAARAQAALAKDDLAGAVKELGGLQGPAAQVAAPWLDQAKARLVAEKALSDLTAHAIAATQANG